MKLKAPINHGEKCYESVNESLQNLRTQYLDLVLIHWPGVKGLQLDDYKNVEMRKKTWQTLEQFYFERKVRLIGVSNYTIKHLKQLLEYCQVIPHVLQVNSQFSY